MFKQSPLIIALSSAISLPSAAAPLPDPASASRLAQIEVVGSEEALKRAPGSGAIVSAKDLDRIKPFTINEVLRSVPGVVMRDEEGFGLRPNIGIRGLNPTRSTKVLLLEDGLPAAYAPYGDNASYYHAPVDRYERIEVLKGVGMLRFGPQTISGVINYQTPEPPQDFAGFVALTGGNRGYGNAHLRLGGGGAMLDLLHKRGEGARDTLELAQNDATFKYVADLGETQRIQLRANFLTENSQVGYSGLTEAELRNFGPRYGFDQSAQFEIERYGGSLSHEWDLSDRIYLLTNLYGSRFYRDWWRQSSSTTDTQCGTAFRDARQRGERVDFGACNSTQGRLRGYEMQGIEPRVTANWGDGSIFEAGVRWHEEVQNRRQINGTSPTARAGTLAENNLRDASAFAAFVSNRFRFGALELAPIVRFEDIEYERNNLLNGRRGKESISEVIPGLGLNYSFSDELALFAGAHRGFAPPRVEDVIDNNGVGVDVGAEESLNIEFGVRGEVRDLQFEATAFRNRFDPQVLVGSIAGGGVPLATGETLYQGLEALGRFQRGNLFAEGTSFVDLAFTWVPTARQEAALRAVSNGAVVAGSEPGKRLPYAPKTAATLRVGHDFGEWDASMEGVYVDEQFGDFANRTSVDPSGQFGVLPSYTIANLTVGFEPEGSPYSAFVAVKNVFDRDYIVDRTRGIQTGSPRLLHVGVRYRF